MTAKVKSMVQSIVVLCVIALCSGLILGLFNKLTWVDPQKDVLDKFATLSGTSAKFEMLDKDNGQTYFFAKSKEETPTYALYVGGKGGFGGEVKMYVFVRGGVITGVAVGENSETYMDKLQEAGFIDAFVGQELATLSIPSGSDLVSGATKSSTAVADAMKTAKEYFASYLQGGNA